MKLVRLVALFLGLAAILPAQSRVSLDHRGRISCYVAASTATTIQAVGGSCVAPGAGLFLRITSVTSSSSAAAGTAADSFNTIKYGTGGTCGTGTAVLWASLHVANGAVHAYFQPPLRVPANNELCWINSTAGTKVFHINGYIDTE